MTIVDLYNQYDDSVNRWLEEIETAQRNWLSWTFTNVNDPVLACYKKIRDELRPIKDEFEKNYTPNQKEIWYEMKLEQLRQEKNEFDQYRNAHAQWLEKNRKWLVPIINGKIHDTKQEKKELDIWSYEIEYNLKKMAKEYKSIKNEKQKLSIVDRFIEKHRL